MGVLFYYSCVYGITPCIKAFRERRRQFNETGTIDTGMIVTEVLPVLTTIEDIELKAIMSTPQSLDKAETLAKQYGLTQATSDYEAILSNPDVDTIYVGTPNHTHYDYAKQALLAGKHVICEKPFTLHLEEFEELIKLA